MSRYGFMRLDGQETQISRQALQLDTIGGFDRLFVERQEKAERWEQRGRLLSLLQSGDVVYAASADRICDSLKDFLELAEAVDQNGAALVLLEEGLDTRTSAGQKSLRLLASFRKIDFACQSRRKRVGIARARDEGRRIGRPPVSIPAGFRDLCRQWSLGEITGPEAVRRSGLKQTSFYKKAAELGYKPAPKAPNPPADSDANGTAPR